MPTRTLPPDLIPTADQPAAPDTRSPAYPLPGPLRRRTRYRFGTTRHRTPVGPGAAEDHPERADVRSLAARVLCRIHPRVRVGQDRARILEAAPVGSDLAVAQFHAHAEPLAGA